MDHLHRVVGIFGPVQEAEESQNKACRQREMAMQIRQSRTEEPACLVHPDFLKDNISEKVEPPPPGTSRRLPEVQRREVDRVAAENDRFARHVDPKAERTSSHHDGEKTTTEADFHRLAILPVHTGVVDADAALKCIDQSFI